MLLVTFYTLWKQKETSSIMWVNTCSKSTLKTLEQSSTDVFFGVFIDLFDRVFTHWSKTVCKIYSKLTMLAMSFSFVFFSFYFK